MSPRRSSRARIAQPPNGPAHSTSSSSVTSSRAERSTRSNNKHQSPRKSSTPHSLSSDDVDDRHSGPQNEPPQTRRRTRGQDNEEEDNSKVDEDIEDDIAEEEEVTRCVCGHQEYPGPPSDGGRAKEGQLPSSQTGSEVVGDEAGGLFIQCDICKVWQHGGCVGIMDEAASPEEYFCEECRKDLHKIMSSPHGQKYSRYLPVLEQAKSEPRKLSMSKDSDTKPAKDKEKLSRSSVEALSKRRSTMNSRAAYDEDEVLRKVIEESKNEGGSYVTDNGSQKKKRSRDDSEETKNDSKRLRTGSRSPASSLEADSDDENRNTKNGGRHKPRGAAARSQREREAKDREKERERERAEAAGRRKGRAERRRQDDPEPIDEATPSAKDTSQQPEAQEPPDTPNLSNAANNSSSHKKNANRRAAQKRGRNQYTRDQPTPNPAMSPINHADHSPSPPSGRPNGNDSGGNNSDAISANKASKPRNWRLEKMSWNEIRRPAGVMLNYIQQRQVELAGERNGSAAVALAHALASNGANSPFAKNHAKGEQTDLESLEKFRTLSSVEMMDHLSRDLELWQQTVKELEK